MRNSPSVHPKSVSLSYDIGLFELAATPNVTPAARYKGSSELGKVGTFVGYGKTGTGLTGATSFDGQKRAGQNIIDAAFVDTGGQKKWRVFGSDFDSPAGNTNCWGSSSPLDLEYLVSFGDSGGDVFIEENGKSYLAGIHSFLADYNRNDVWGDYGDYSGHMRVSVFNSWIDSIISGTGKKGRGNANLDLEDFLSNNTAAVPEPATLGLLALGAIGLLRRRPFGLDRGR